MSLRYMFAGQRNSRLVQETLVPDDDMIFVRAEKVSEITINESIRCYSAEDFIRKVSFVYDAGVLPYGTKVVLMSEALEARLKKAGVKVRLLNDVVRETLASNWDLKSIYPFDTTFYRDRRSARNLVRVLQEQENLGRDLQRFMKQMEPHMVDYSSRLLSVIQVYAADLAAQEDPFGKDNLWQRILQKCPLLENVPDKHIPYYLKLEGKLK